MKCPICNGTGELPAPKLLFPYRRGVLKLKKQACKILRSKGFSIREIQKILGYKSPRSVQIYIKEEEDVNG